MRKWSWSKGGIRVDSGDGWKTVFDFEDFWRDHGDDETEVIAEFIVDACNEKEQREEKGWKQQVLESDEFAERAEERLRQLGSEYQPTNRRKILKDMNTTYTAIIDETLG